MLLFFMQITSAGLWSQNKSESNYKDVPEAESVTDSSNNPDENGDDQSKLLTAELWLNWIGSSARKGKLALKFWKSDNEIIEPPAESFGDSRSSKPIDVPVFRNEKEEPRPSFPMSPKESLKAVIAHFCRKLYRRLSFVWTHALRFLRSLWVSITKYNSL